MPVDSVAGMAYEDAPSFSIDVPEDYLARASLAEGFEVGFMMGRLRKRTGKEPYDTAYEAGYTVGVNARAAVHASERDSITHVRFFLDVDEKPTFETTPAED